MSQQATAPQTEETHGSMGNPAASPTSAAAATSINAAIAVPTSAAAAQKVVVTPAAVSGGTQQHPSTIQVPDTRTTDQDSQFVLKENAMPASPLPDMMKVVEGWLMSVSDAKQMDPIPASPSLPNSPGPSPRSSSNHKAPAAALSRKESAAIAKESGAPSTSVTTPAQLGGAAGTSGKVRPTVVSSDPTKPAAAAANAHLSHPPLRASANQPPTTSTTTRDAAAIAAAAAAASSTLPPKSVIDAQVQGLLMCPAWASIRTSSKDILTATYTTDAFRAPLDFNYEEGTLGAMDLTSVTIPAYNPSVHWALHDPKAQGLISRVATPATTMAAAPPTSRIAANKRLFSVSASCM